MFHCSEWDHVQDVQVWDRAAGRPQTRQAQSVGERHRHGNHVSCCRVFLLNLRCSGPNSSFLVKLTWTNQVNVEEWEQRPWSSPSHLTIIVYRSTWSLIISFSPERMAAVDRCWRSFPPCSYGQLFVMYLKHHSRTANSPSAEVVLYHLPRYTHTHTHTEQKHVC